MITKKINISFILLGLNLFIFSKLIAQQQTISYAPYLEVLEEDLDSTIIQFIKEQQLLEDIDFKSIIPFDALRKVLPDLSGLVTQSSGRIQLQSQYNQGLGIDSSNIWYNSIGLQKDLQIANIPLRINGRLISTNGEISPDLSTFSIDFNHRVFLNNLKPRLIEPSTNILNNPTSFFNLPKQELPISWSKEELEMIKAEIVFQLYQQIISHPNFITITKQKDSIKQIVRDTLSTTKALVNSTKVTIQQKRQEGQHILDKELTEKQKKLKEREAVILAKGQVAEQMVTKYNDQWKIRKTYYGDSLQVVKEKINRFSKQYENINQTNNIRKQIKNNTSFSLLERILTNTEKISLGQSTLDDSWYTAKQLPMSGLQYQFSTDKISGAVAVGKQRFNNFNTPLWTNDLFQRVDGGNLLFAKIGYRFVNESSLEYSFLNIKNSGNINSGFSPENNSIFSIAGAIESINEFVFNARWSFSRNSWGQTNLDYTKQLSVANSALELTVSKSFFNQQTNIELGYFYVGDQFYTAANPFLITNQQGLVGKIISNIGTKLDVSAELKIGQTINEIIFNGEQKNLQLLGTINWRPTPKISFSGQIAPNTFKHFGSGQISVSNSNTLYNGQISIQQRIGESQLISSIGFTNYRGQLAYQDSTTLNQTNYLFLQQTLSLSNTLNFSLLSMAGKVEDPFEQNEPTYTFFSQLNMNIQKQKWDGAIGFQVIKDAFIAPWYYGVTNYQEFRFNNQIAFSIDVSYQIPKQNRDQLKSRFWGNLAISKRF